MDGTADELFSLIAVYTKCLRDMEIVMNPSRPWAASHRGPSQSQSSAGQTGVVSFALFSTDIT